MKKLILAAFGLALLTSCTGSNPVTPVVCDLEKTASVALASSVMSFCSCSDKTQVASFLMGKIPASLNLCPAAGKVGSIVGSLVCAPVINGLAGSACRQIPSCSGDVPSNAQIQAAIDLCKSKL